MDRGIAAPGSAVVRVLAWAATNYVLMLAAGAVAYLLVALPPLSLLPSQDPLSFGDHVLGVLVYGSVGWPVHLAVVAAVSRTRLARLGVVLTSPLLGLVVLFLPYAFAALDATNRSVVLAWTLYALVCRLMPPGGGRRAPRAARPGR